MKYFRSFPTVKYDTLGDGVSSVMTDFTPNFKVRNANLIKNISYMNYTIGDGERPDTTSNILYGTTAYHWTFFTINDHLRKGISEWPLSQRDLDNYVSAKYGKYACITFNPINQTEDENNLSYIPFTEKYIDSLYLAIDTTDGVAYRKIIRYDTLSCQMIIERDNPIFNFNDNEVQDEFDPVDMTIGNFIKQNSYRVVSILFTYDADDNKTYVTGLNQDFIEEVNNAYGLEEGESSEQYHYNVAIDSSGNDLNYELMKNAPFQFYTEINEELTSLSTYDIIAGDMIYPNVNRITYEEMEQTLNERKRTISVINPANIGKFAESYFTVLNNG